jgi:hypothetical protein
MAQDERATPYGVVIEKIPFFVLAVIMGVVALLTQEVSGGLADTRTIPWMDRVANAFLSYGIYVSKMFWPQHLAIPYPLRPAGSIPLGQVLLSALLLASISILVLHCWRTR